MPVFQTAIVYLLRFKFHDIWFCTAKWLFNRTHVIAKESQYSNTFGIRIPDVSGIQIVLSTWGSEKQKHLKTDFYLFVIQMPSNDPLSDHHLNSRQN